MDSVDTVKNEVLEERVPSRTEIFLQLEQRIKDVKAEPPIKHDPDNVLEVHNLIKYVPIKTGLVSRVTGYVRAVDGVSFNIKKGTTMGLVGESGCGKTTVGKTILRLTEKTAGQVCFNGTEIHDIPKGELRITTLTHLANLLYQRNWSAEKRASAAAESGPKYVAGAKSNIDKYAFFDGASASELAAPWTSSALTALSDREEARAIAAYAKQIYMDFPNPSPVEQQDYKILLKLFTSWH